MFNSECISNARSLLGSRVVHYGPLPRDQYWSALHQADIAVSTAKHEFFGVAMSVIKYFYRPLLVFNVCVPDSGWKQWPAAAIHSVQTDWCIQKSIPVSC